MKTQLTVALRVWREQFLMEHFIGTDDIFALVRDGSFWVESHGKTVTVNPCEGFLFRRDVLYHRRVIKPVVMYLFRYKSESHAFEGEHVIFRDRARVASTILMLEQLEAGVSGDDFEARAHLFSDLTMQHAMENRSAWSTDAVIENAMHEIVGSLHHGVDLKRIGTQTGLSYVQFLRRFKQLTGITPSEYVISLRLQKAKTLLADTDLLIKDVACACGFENEYYFSNFFKSHTQLSPSAFRAASRT